MKRIISILLMLSMLFSTVAMAEVEETLQNGLEVSPISGITNIEKYDIKEITFSPLNTMLALKNNDSMSDEKFIQLKNIENINQIRVFIKDLNLKKEGQMDLEKKLLEDLKKLEKDSGYIDKYKLYIPKAELEFSTRSTTSPAYYGTYNNRKFRDYFSVYYESFQESSSVAKLQDWAEGGFNILLIWAPKTISLGYILLEAATRDGIKNISIDDYEYQVSDEVTRHYITIQDLNDVMGCGSNAFFVTIIDEARVNTTDLVIDYVSPAYPSVTDNLSYMEPIYCSTWYNSKSSQMLKGYNQFLADPGATANNLLGPATFDW